MDTTPLLLRTVLASTAKSASCTGCCDQTPQVFTEEQRWPESASKHHSGASLVKLMQMLAETVVKTKHKPCMHLFKKHIQRGLFLLNVAHRLPHFKRQSQEGNYLE